jgi:hypothetical protein
MGHRLLFLPSVLGQDRSGDAGWIEKWYFVPFRSWFAGRDLVRAARTPEEAARVIDTLFHRLLGLSADFLLSAGIGLSVTVSFVFPVFGGLWLSVVLVSVMLVWSVVKGYVFSKGLNVQLKVKTTGLN